MKVRSSVFLVLCIAIGVYSFFFKEVLFSVWDKVEF